VVPDFPEKNDLIITVRYVERYPLRVDLDHRAVRVVACRHEGAFKRAERNTRGVHQFSQNLGDVLRLTRRDRYVMDHLNALRGWICRYMLL
jgi:hypothetical protein